MEEGTIRAIRAISDRLEGLSSLYLPSDARGMDGPEAASRYTGRYTRASTVWEEEAYSMSGSALCTPRTPRTALTRTDVTAHVQRVAESSAGCSTARFRDHRTAQRSTRGRLSKTRRPGRKAHARVSSCAASVGPPRSSTVRSASTTGGAGAATAARSTTTVLARPTAAEVTAAEAEEETFDFCPSPWCTLSTRLVSGSYSRVRVTVRATVEVRLRDLSYRRSRDLAKMRADLCNVQKNLVY